MKCVLCSRRAVRGRQKCRVCTTRVNAYRKAKRAAQIARGLCAHLGCDKPPEGGNRMCGYHTRTANEANQRARGAVKPPLLDRLDNFDDCL